jgi:hypothetical protein
MSKLRRLPDGNITEDLDTYLNAWKREAQPLMDKTGWKLIGFDPSFQFMKDDKLSITLPLWAVRDLVK